MSLQKRTLALSVTLLLILSVLFLGGARIASAAFQTPDSGMPFVSAVFQSDNLGNRQSGEVEFTGDIQAIGSDSWTIGGLVVNIQPGTEFKGSFGVGDQVKVHVFRDVNGELFALEISPFAAGSIGLTNDNANEGNENESLGEDNANNDNSNETISENDDNKENENESITNGNSNGNSDDDNSNSSISEDDDNGNDDRGANHGNGNGNTHDDDHEEHSSINWNQ